jgi:ferredoxin-NADP reductase
VAGTAVLGRLTWREAEVVALRDETPTVRTLVLDLPGWPGHRAGQHVDIRLTAPDGYQAHRSYSLASPPDAARLEVTVERLDDGEVSPYLNGVLAVGDRIELRGPIGGWFVWTPDLDGPVLLVGGGSGVVPLMAMARARRDAGAMAPMRLLLSSRTLEDVVYRDELDRLAAAGDGLTVVHTLTRESAERWPGHRRRVDTALLAEVGWPPAEAPRIYVCGPTPFVEVVAGALVGLGHPPGTIKTERFGATGGSP